MPGQIERAAASIYGRLWHLIEKWLLVPKDPPSLPAGPGEAIESFHPAPGFLSYLKLWFWMALVAVDAILILAWVGITLLCWWLGLILAVPFWFLIIAPDIVAYVAIHLRYDATWYVMSERSLRIRRGIWILHEVTITFENVQNVSVTQGPVQRFFGIADVVVETAGARAASGEHGTTIDNRGIIEGIAGAEQIKDKILSKLRKSRTAGLGDEWENAPPAEARASRFSPEHVTVLREILACMKEMGQAV